MALQAKLRELYEVSDVGHRLLSLEGLRGFAVLLVFFVHFDALFAPYIRLHPILEGISRFLGNVGNTGVDLFFVLSGYLIYGALLRKETPYLTFVRRRIERIYPAFLGVFCFYIILSVLFRSENKIHGSVFNVALYIAENVLLLPGVVNIAPIITVAWSLSYEFLFYLSIPVVISVMRMRRWKRVARASFFLGVWVFCVLLSFAFSQSKVRLLMFVAGILLYELLDSGWLRGKLNRRGEIVAIGMFLASLAFVYLYDARSGWFWFLPRLAAGRTLLPGVPSFQGPYKVIVLSISCVMLTLYSFEFEGLLKALFSWSGLRYLGNMSYSYYLIHALTLHAIALVAYSVAPESRPNVPVFLASLFIGFGATCVTSTLLFGLIEKPISIKRRENRSGSAAASGKLYPIVAA